MQRVVLLCLVALHFIVSYTSQSTVIHIHTQSSSRFVCLCVRGLCLCSLLVVKTVILCC